MPLCTLLELSQSPGGIFDVAAAPSVPFLGCKSRKGSMNSVTNDLRMMVYVHFPWDLWLILQEGGDLSLNILVL